MARTIAEREHQRFAVILSEFGFSDTDDVPLSDVLRAALVSSKAERAALLARVRELEEERLLAAATRLAIRDRAERAEARVRELEQQLTDAGIVDDDGTLRWVFRPNEVEVSAGGGGSRRLFHLLRQVRYLIDDLWRRQDKAEATVRELEQARDQATRALNFLHDEWPDQAALEARDAAPQQRMETDKALTRRDKQAVADDDPPQPPIGDARRGST